jgi:predicted ATPase/DNA-binding SARP family transcriptional activator
VTTTESAPEIAGTAALSITLFGPMAVIVQGRPLPRLRSRRALWLLALLTLRANRPVEREWLAGTLWPDADQNQAFANLRVILSELRQALASAGGRLESPNRRSLRLNVTGAEVDVLAFDAAIKGGTTADLERAVALYRGPLLEGCLEEWAPQERIGREQDCLSALGKLAEAALAAGDPAGATGYWRRAVAIDPLSDGVRQGLMEALSRSGDTNAALQVYREFVHLLRSDPTGAPDAQTSALYQRLREEARQRAASSGLPTIVAANEPAAPVVPSVRGYLPHPITELVGRKDERLEVALLLRRSRLVTLTGAGGIGKTRLAIEVAGGVVQEFPDGVWLVALESLAEGRLVLPQIASVLGLKDVSGRTPLQVMTDYLRQKRLLLVLDNCEHLIEASAQIVDYLLRECGGVRVLATSREALGITGETVWSVPALSVPDVEQLPSGRATLLRVLMGYESVRLFVERAEAIQKGFVLSSSNAPLVAQVCQQLEGIPLAIELAAARVRAMSVAQIAARLDNELSLLIGGNRAAQSRQQTLRAALDWSYTLLTDAEQRLLRWLSVFAGGWTLEAAETVCSEEEIESWQVRDLLVSLVDKSLVAFEERGVEARYRLLEMVRQYGAEKLTAAGETNRLRARHRDYFLALAEAAEPELTRANQGVWLDRLEAERANLGAALDYCKEEPEGASAGLRLASALHKFWEIHGHFSEGQTSLSTALARPGAESRTNERARALHGAGVLSYYQGDYRASRSLQEESLAIFRELGDRQGIAWALNGLADVADVQGEHDAARTLYEESLSLFRELGDRHGIASLLHHLGRVVRDQGDFDAARAYYEENLAIFRELGNRQNVAWALYHLGNVAAQQGNYEAAYAYQNEGLAIFRELGNRQGAAWVLHDLADAANVQGARDVARALYEESLSLFRELGNKLGVALTLHYSGDVIGAQGDFETAEALQEESLALQRELENGLGVSWALISLGRLALERGDPAAARAFYEESLRIEQALDDRRGAARSLEGLAATSLAQDDLDRAMRLWGAAQALRERFRAPLLPKDRAWYDRLLERMGTLRGDAAFEAAWNEGQDMTLEQAVSLVLNQARE